MMKTAILSLVAVAATASPTVVHLNEENPSDINDFSRLRGGRELGKHGRKHKHKDAVGTAGESLMHAMETEVAPVSSNTTETGGIQKVAKSEKRMKNKEKEKRAREKRDRKNERGVKKPPLPKGERKKKHHLKDVPKSDAPPPVLMAKTSKPTSSEPNASAPLDPKNATERGALKTSSPSTMIPSFQPTFSPTSMPSTMIPSFQPTFFPTTELGENVSAEPPSLAPITSDTLPPTTELDEMGSTDTPSLAPITSDPTILVITRVPTVVPTTSAPVANETTTSLPTFVPSYSPTGGKEGVETTPTTPAPSSVVTMPGNSTVTPISSALKSLPPTSATSAVVPATVGDVASTPTTPSPTSSVVVSAPPDNSTTPDDASEIVPDCPPAYDATKTTYVGGDEATVNEHIFECQTIYEKYCNIPEWYDSLSTSDANAKESWNDAWMHIGPCVAVTSDEV